MATTNWTADNIPSQQGKTILITGANSGLGLEASKVLSGKGAQVIMTVRNLQKGKEAVETIKKENPDAKLDLMLLDLSDFQSIRRFSEDFHSRYSQLHVLINNAGVMSPPNRELTKQGFEVQFGANHLGHFLLTGLLLDITRKTPNSRIAVQSSLAHKHKQYGGGYMVFEDLNFEKKTYNKDHAYGQSKLANLLFAYELERKLKAHHISTIVTAAHPGYTNTNLQKNFGFFIKVIMNKLVAQKVEMGTLPILRAATEEGLKGSEFFGPTKMNEIKGFPELVKSNDKSYDKEIAKRLWEVSEKLTGFTYKFD
ncbi:SDR family NAD(P)-dependent oxidoreductase [Pedobacter sp. ISL-68]|uniref:oxidoreductase n=1 Tax=unclassified Pedobacter TaxID=2628915 RepID=UPI001BEB84AB|nr:MULTISPECIES: oxidoreductase [unclassified Pedobacter]MBT2560705.1 SDR family NAD(P)-dependent oxidoreductase [Pedobacter sp. ISL-64]MBT2590084.1 SDR family NAD(P)-dependent oxidoreductase [Pedobacter sp. ISL-68]